MGVHSDFSHARARGHMRFCELTGKAMSDLVLNVVFMSHQGNEAQPKATYQPGTKKSQEGWSNNGH